MTSPAPTPVPAPDFDPAAWRHALNQLAAPGLERLLIVQCSLDWLRPPHQALRDATDAAVLDACTRHPHLQVDRIVLHNLPVLGATAAGDLAQLNTALAAWMYRLTVTAMLLTHPERQRIHRLIVPGRDTTAGLADHLDQQRNGHTWQHPRRTEPVLRLLTTGRRTTPLTGYDVDLDGPFGDADPSVYL